MNGIGFLIIVVAVIVVALVDGPGRTPPPALTESEAVSNCTATYTGQDRADCIAAAHNTDWSK